MPAISVNVIIKRNDLPKMVAHLREQAPAVTEATADAIVTDAKSIVHVITGNLRDSIRAEKVDAYYWTVTAGSDEVDYASYEEFGTRFRGPHPYLTPAAERHRQPHIDRVKDLFKP